MKEWAGNGLKSEPVSLSGGGQRKRGEEDGLKGLALRKEGEAD